MNAPDLRVVDASYYLPPEGLNAREEFERHHIPGSVFFDIDDIADTQSGLPHMVPSPQKFSSRVRKLGLGDGLRFVIYDQKGIWSSPRVWWTFKHFGHEDVAVLDGGLPKWMNEGRPTEDGPDHSSERHFTARVNSFLIRDKEQVFQNLENGREQILDARPNGRFAGRDPEPRPGLRQGHIPGSLNLPYSELLDPVTQTMLAPDRIEEKFTAAGADLNKPIITSCGSGITAAILSLGLTLINHRDAALYDGSWAEWGLPGETPVVQGDS
ncbi:MAG: sulfurtransferase [Kiloniellales bacterium]|nr:sulfurtransferase [Kiloniellales bacterium]